MTIKDKIDYFKSMTLNLTIVLSSLIIAYANRGGRLLCPEDQKECFGISFFGKQLNEGNTLLLALIVIIVIFLAYYIKEWHKSVLKK
ncbi:hypothetical protein HOC11_06180 [archaeon]|nr:hypothetical protein [archaeon]